MVARVEAPGGMAARRAGSSQESELEEQKRHVLQTTISCKLIVIVRAREGSLGCSSNWHALT